MSSVSISLLELADQVLATPEQWTKGATRRDSKGRKPMLDRDAVCWCLGGAVIRAMDQIPRTKEDCEVAASLLNHAVENITGKRQHYVNYNDAPNTQFSDIKEVLRVAISLGKKED